jgi:hypothetical protein
MGIFDVLANLAGGAGQGYLASQDVADQNAAGERQAMKDKLAQVTAELQQKGMVEDLVRKTAGDVAATATRAPVGAAEQPLPPDQAGPVMPPTGALAADPAALRGLAGPLFSPERAKTAEAMGLHERDTTDRAAQDKEALNQSLMGNRELTQELNSTKAQHSNDIADAKLKMQQDMFPLMQALTTAKTSAEQAKAMKALEDRMHSSETAPFESAVQQGPAGKNYLDMTNFPTGKMHDKAVEYAAQNGVMPLDAKHVSALQGVDRAASAARDMLSDVDTLLSPQKGAGGLESGLNKLTSGLSNKAGALVGTNPTAEAWNTNRIPAIQQLIALAGGQGSGLRINQAEIKNAVENDIPTLFNTREEAQRKIGNILLMLRHQHESILGLKNKLNEDSKFGKNGVALRDLPPAARVQAILATMDRPDE